MRRTGRSRFRVGARIAKVRGIGLVSGLGSVHRVVHGSVHHRQYA
jgi:hypothetical protein